MLIHGPWTESEDAEIRAKYPTTNSQVLANDMRRTVSAPKHRASRLGVTKSAAYLDEARTKASRTGRPPKSQTQGVARRFGEHALPPWVAGTRRHFILDDDEDTGGGAALRS